VDEAAELPPDWFARVLQRLLEVVPLPLEASDLALPLG